VKYTHAHILLLSSAEPLAVKDLRYCWTAEKKNETERDRTLPRHISSRCLYSTVKTFLCSNYIYFFFSSL